MLRVQYINKYIEANNWNMKWFDLDDLSSTLNQHIPIVYLPINVVGETLMVKKNIVTWAM